MSRRLSEILGVALFATALLWMVALVSYSPSDPAWFFNNANRADVANFAGRVGAFLAVVSFQLLGYAAFFLPAVLAFAGWHAFWCIDLDARATKFTGLGLLVICVAGLIALAASMFDTSLRPFRPGGVLGEWTAAGLSAYLNRTGTAILLIALLALAVILSTHFSFGKLFSAIGTRVRGQHGLLSHWRDWREERRRNRERKQIIEKHVKKAGREHAPAIESKVADAVATLKAARARNLPLDDEEEDEDDSKPVARPAPAAKAVKPPAIRRSQVPSTPSLPLEDPETSKAPAERRKGGYTLPPVTLLDAPKDHRKIDERELMDAARLLEEKCKEFDVVGQVVQIHPGPVVTTYEFKPDAGVKYSRITGLADDLCLAMQAESVLIDRIPGKSTVGIQIPNPVREGITLRELLESDTYTRSQSKLTIAMGKTIHGEPFVSDLATMPHLLIAGSTGAGKSVSVNAMVSSILFRSTPEDVRFIMIDPKRLELGMYEDIPHLLTPVVVDTKQAANALQWAVREMEERYKTLAASGVRNIDQYNRNIRAAMLEPPAAKTDKPEGTPELKTMAYVIVIIDELADLMMAAGKEVEESIARLAQMARAVGIHLILATQRPSVDVITGLIKANLPARIAFRVASKIDSRTILDGNGAEQLLGKGDMLYLPPASSRFVRIHGPYISEQETARLCSFLRKQGKPVYDVTITAEDKPTEKLEFEKDELFDEAARIVVSSGQASISYLQRRLRIGFSRAARLIDMMEMDGIVSPATNGKREVLVDQHYFEEVDAQLR
ncbi:MAG TPA: DNA translocase FtsK 4TM domain-containing protein [Vicinamibacterales bacterium]|nr:DNA translocase FtsK 4TM domain-containing protein [Vicinamibacterales bacterium]